MFCYVPQVRLHRIPIRKGKGSPVYNYEITIISLYICQYVARSADSFKNLKQTFIKQN